MSEIDRTRRGARLVAGLLLGSVIGSVVLVIVYASGGQPQLEGLFLGLALACLGGALVVWAHRLLPSEEAEQRWDVGVSAGDRVAAADRVDRAGVLERRPLLRGMLAAALGAFGVAALFPVRSLGPNPGNALRTTPWRRGLRLVDDSGRIVVASEVPIGGLVTAFPEGHVDAADAVAVLIRIDERRLASVAGREGWTPRGFVAYSKICTHAGCPVGLYLDESTTLLCPCHQSEFDVTHQAAPRSGPAARRLPQLPLAINDDDELIATGGFSEPVGPAWWTR